MPLKNKLRKCLYGVIVMMVLPLPFSSCESSYTPKPRGYFRIDLPEKQYQVFDSTFPFRFSYPVYAQILPPGGSVQEKYWMNIDFPAFKGTLYLSYKEINQDLRSYIEDSRALVMKHIPKANAIEERLINRPTEKVYGVLYDIKGSDAASPVQFYLTDSTEYFLRGALYFYVSPNNDSLQPVIDFIEKDVQVLLETLQWKKKPVNL